MGRYLNLANKVVLAKSLYPHRTEVATKATKATKASLSSPAGMPAPLVMKDGRQLYQVHAGRLGRPTEQAARIIGEARAAHVVLVADNAELVIVAPRDQSPAPFMRRIVANAADLLAVLHWESDKRLGPRAEQHDVTDASTATS